MRLQAELLAEPPEWVLICDGGRADVFEAIHGDYLDGDYERVHNGGCLNTPQWFVEHFHTEYNAMLFHGGTPIRAIETHTDYDDRAHFEHVPYLTLYDYDDGFAEHDQHDATCPPDSVNHVIRQHLRDDVTLSKRLASLGYGSPVADREFDFNVVRYVQPHRPYRTLRSTWHGPDDDATVDDVHAAYEDNYRWVLEAITDIVHELPGDVAVTADHGDCLLDCGQWNHGPRNDPHDHLVEVPWLAVAA